MAPFNPIEPDELAHSPLAAGFVTAGMQERDAEWLARILIYGGFVFDEGDSTPLFFPFMLSLEEFTEKIIVPFKEPVPTTKKNRNLINALQQIIGLVGPHRDGRLLAIMAYLADVYRNREYSSFTKIYESNWWKQFIQPSEPFIPISWHNAVKELSEKGYIPKSIKYFRSLINSLKRDKKAFWLSAIRWDLLSEAHVSIDDRIRDPRRLDFWLEAGNPEKAIKNPEVDKAICGYLSEVSDSQLGVAALNLATALTDSLDASEWQYIAPRWTRFHNLYSGEEESIITLLLARYQAQQSDEHLKMALLRLFLLRFRENELNPDIAKPLLTVAKKELGQNRPLLKKDAEKPFDPHSLNAPLAFLFRFGGPSPALETMLTLFSALEHPAVTPDLRYWKEEGLVDPPETYRWIPDRIAAIIHALGAEQEKDPTLESVRRSLAQFFLKRLKSKDNVNDRDVIDDDFIENRWEWRYFYVRALRELKVNPLGKSHHVLRWVSENDPHEEVREEAKKAYKELRHQVSLPAETSPRKPLFAAFWWLRQAHLNSLGIEPDPQGAQRTRSKEVTYTNRT